MKEEIRQLPCKGVSKQYYNSFGGSIDLSSPWELNSSLKAESHPPTGVIRPTKYLILEITEDKKRRSPDLSVLIHLAESRSSVD